jgi:threonine dehydratase
LAPESSELASLVTEESIEQAARAGEGVVRETPIITTRTLSERAGTRTVLKAENLQGTGSFKLRGAMAKIAALGDATARGVVCGSAGNHAQAVAYAALSRGVPCEVFMPEAAPIAKADAVQALGATLHLEGRSVDDSVAAAKARAAEAGMQFIHPFDDPDVISGQGGVGLELLRQVPDMARVVVPVGGGGLISGIAVAIRSQRPDVEIIGVQVEACAPFAASLEAGEPVAVESVRTIADGIAVKRPGDITLRLIDALVKEVVEGAGAVGVAALLAGRLPGPVDGTTVLVLSGGNVGAGLLAEVARRHETQARRRLVLSVRLPDLPGSLAALLATVGRTGANLLDVTHLREGLDLHIQETAVQLVLETRGAEHASAVRAAIEAAGYRDATEIL